MVFVVKTYPFFLPFEVVLTEVPSPGPRQFG
jgi:hypothetical protein